MKVEKRTVVYFRCPSCLSKKVKALHYAYGETTATLVCEDCGMRFEIHKREIL